MEMDADDDYDDYDYDYDDPEGGSPSRTGSLVGVADHATDPMDLSQGASSPTEALLAASGTLRFRGAPLLATRNAHGNPGYGTTYATPTPEHEPEPEPAHRAPESGTRRGARRTPAVGRGIEDLDTPWARIQKYFYPTTDGEITEADARKHHNRINALILISFIIMLSMAWGYNYIATLPQIAIVQTCRGEPTSDLLYATYNLGKKYSYACSTFYMGKDASVAHNPGCICCVPSINITCWSAVLIDHESARMADVVYTVIGENPPTVRKDAIPVKAHMCFMPLPTPTIKNEYQCIDVEGLDVQYVYRAMEMLYGKPFRGKKM